MAQGDGPPFTGMLLHPGGGREHEITKGEILMQIPVQEYWRNKTSDGYGRSIGRLDDTPASALARENWQNIIETHDGFAVSQSVNHIAIVAYDHGPWAIVTKGSLALTATGEVFLEIEEEEKALDIREVNKMISESEGVDGVRIVLEIVELAKEAGVAISEVKATRNGSFDFYAGGHWYTVSVD